MKILMVASEATPFAKTGGLADVIGSLPAALAAKGVETAVVMPYYRSITNMERRYDRMPVRLSPTASYSADIRTTTERGVQFLFVDVPALFGRPALYGEKGEDYPDNHIRFAVFCRAVLGIIRSVFRPDIIHCHDWQASLIGAMMKHQFRADPTYIGIPNILTIHNLGYQGIFPREALADIGFGPAMFHPARMEFWGRINYLKTGIVFADRITTVSEAYAREIQTEEYGFGLDGLLRARAADIVGILNGVDYGEWSPETDPYIATQYSVDDLSGKQLCKRDLLRAFGLPDDDLTKPVIGIVSRFASQKGFDLIAAAMPEILAGDVFLTVLGAGEPQYETLMKDLAARFPGKASVIVAYNNQIAHQVEAGSDIFLMPSRYEPCGLNQIYSLRYGTVPVVRATGGLDDTIDESTGFKFTDYTPEALLQAMQAALTAYQSPVRWTELMKNGMRRDHSWSTAAAEYIRLYEQLMAV